jgi:signal transduction histidine kinase
MGKHFNRMRTRIRKTETENRELVARLSRLNQELEARVARVTQELSEHNTELLRLQREIIRVGPLAALGQITGTIAHELGTPLNSVLGYTQLLLQEELPEGAQRRLQIIESQVQRMVDTIQYYLSRTRGAIPRQQQVNVNNLVQETLLLLEPFFQQHRVQVSIAPVEPLPPLSADSASLQRMLINLLNNAVDAMAEGGTVTVATRMAAPLEATRQGIFLEIADTGSGIPPELLPKVFDLFVTTKTPGEGVGLGLAICQEIVKAHGGTIEITSQMGQGTWVRIFLPTAEMTNDPVPAEEQL